MVDYSSKRQHVKSLTARVAQWAAMTSLLTFPVAPAQALLAGGIYVPTGSTTTTHDVPTVTLLQNGKVLLAGGGSAELYDPATGTWSATGNPTAVRRSATATLLQNGKVLVAGGQTGTTVLATTELYDPATGTWTASGPMTSPRNLASATLLANGKVLIVGGASANQVTTALNSAELYDPASGTATATGSFVGNRYKPEAIRLDNGKVLMAGGASPSGTPLSSSALYDPTSGTWTSTGAMATARVHGPAVKLANGKVLIAGGYSAGTSAEIYDPAIGTWSAAANMLLAIQNHSLVLLPSGQVLAGVDFDKSSQVYDPVVNTWQTAGFPATSHLGNEQHGVLLGNGDVLFVPGGAADRLAELYRSVLPRTKTDFNGDGKSDIVFENGIGRRWLYNMSGANVQATAALPGAAPGWVLVGMGDFDSNGTTDMLWQNSVNKTQYWIYLMNGPTVIGGGPITAALGFKPTHIADFNGDHRADILWENSIGARWFYFMSGASVTSSAPVPAAAPGWEIAAVGDFNGDTRADLLWVNTSAPTQYWIFLMNGSTVIGGGGVNVGTGYRPTRIGDMNRDGTADIIWENGSNSRWLYAMDGALVVGTVSLPLAAAGWTMVGVGNFDNAGGLDLLWQNTANPTQYWIYLLSTFAVVTGGGGLTVAPGYQPLTQ